MPQARQWRIGRDCGGRGDNGVRLRRDLHRRPEWRGFLRGGMAGRQQGMTDEKCAQGRQGRRSGIGGAHGVNTRRADKTGNGGFRSNRLSDAGL